MKSKPIRSPKHLKFIKGHNCMITREGQECNGTPVDPHHLMKIGNRGLGRKENDSWCVPLCRTHHCQVTRYGDERKFWALYGYEYEEVKERAKHLASISPCERIRLTIKGE